MIKYITGDVTKTELNHIAHGVNCQDAMGSGVARSLFLRWSKVKSEYHRYNSYFKDTPELLLGKVHKIKVEQDRYVYNCYTQFYYGYQNERLVNYAAIVRAFETFVDWDLKQIAIPKIGCGLAGGEWKFVEQLINDTVGDKLEVWVYEREEDKPKYSKRNDLG